MPLKAASDVNEKTKPMSARLRRFLILLSLATSAAAFAAVEYPAASTLARPEPYLGLGHTEPVTILSWSPNGRTLAAGSEDHTVVLWDAVTWKPRATLLGLTHAIQTVAWSPDGSSLAASDAQNDAILWDAATGRRRALLTGHVGRVDTLAWSPNGKYLVSVDDSRAFLWDAATGRRRATLKAGATRYNEYTVAWSPDSGKLAVGGDVLHARGLTLWDAAAAKPHPSFSDERGVVLALAWSPDGKMLAGLDSIGRKLTTLVWDAATRARRASFPGPGSDWLSPRVWWSPDGRLLAVPSAGEGHNLALLDAATGAVRSVLPGVFCPNEDNLMEWSPDSKALATGDCGHKERVILWNPVTGERRATLIGLDSDLGALSWSPDGKVVSASDDSATVLWSSATGKLLARLPEVSPPAWNPKRGIFAAGSFPSATIEIRDELSGKSLRLAASHAAPISHLAWSPDGTAIAAGTDEQELPAEDAETSRGFVTVWALTTGKPRYRLGHLSSGPLRAPYWLPDRIYDLAWSPDGSTIATTAGQYGLAEGIVGGGGPPPRAWYRSSAALWDAKTGRQRAALPDAKAVLAWSPDGRTLATGTEGSILLWDPVSGERRAALPAGSTAWRLAWSPDGKSLAAPAYPEGRFVCLLWDVTTGQVGESLPLSGRSYPNLAWSPAGTLLATTTDDRLVHLWDTATGILRHTLTLQALPPADDWVTARPAVLAWSPDGRLVAAGSPRWSLVKLWSAETGALRAILMGPREGVSLLQWSPDGKTLACACGDHTAVLWDPTSRKRRGVLSGHTGPITGLSWSPDGRTLATCSEDGSLRLWSSAAGKEIANFYSLDGGNEWLALTVEGYFAASPHGADVLQWRQGRKLWPVAKFRRRFERPDLVRQALSAHLAGKRQP
jgi:WD40 repeat protein